MNDAPSTVAVFCMLGPVRFQRSRHPVDNFVKNF